ncbi:MAG: D-alanine--D-alanine ligase [Chlamydiae bacterium]|nr:D-alanine--D-alanine ligase [Chlamydiota bacterium]
MGKKINIGVLFGGKSSEHEVSLLSAKNVIGGLDRNKYDIHLIGIDKQGQWHLHDEAVFLLNADNPKQVCLAPPTTSVALTLRKEDKQLLSLSGKPLLQKLDVVFPVLHGTNGEDGTVQGILKLADIPFVGASVLGSAINMDKDVMKRLLRDAGIPAAKFMTYKRSALSQISFENIKNELGLPFFIKPANGGSSVGISKIRSSEGFMEKVLEAFSYDNKIIFEEGIEGREIECAVLGNDYPIVSLPGEVIHTNDFFDYEAKYLPGGLIFEAPAKVSEKDVPRFQEVALKTYKTLCAEGMARVDFFFKPNGEILVNEINTIPGFTSLSTYPTLWKASGLNYSELLDRLIELALERSEQEKSLRSSFL